VSRPDELKAPHPGFRASESTSGTHRAPQNGPIARMSEEPSIHSLAVRAWLDRAGADRSAAALGAAFELGFAAVWDRAHRTLGDVTLCAIGSRVLWVAAARFPELAGLEVVPSGLVADGLAERLAGLAEQRRVEALLSVLVEFLTLLGRLTGEILTPALHEELANLSPPPVPPEPPRRAHGEASES
jgi:hypothetical protein